MSKCMRKQFENDFVWEDKEAKKHNHEYTIPCILELRLAGKLKRGLYYWVYVYHIMMCKHCHSINGNNEYGENFFKMYKSTSDEDNYLLNIPTEYKDLPHIIGYKENSMIGFNDVDKIVFPDGYIWDKK